MIEAIDRGERRICLTSPTGGGKGLMIGDLIGHFVDLGKKGIAYTNRKMLVEQLSRSFDKMGIDHGIRASGYDGEHWPVQIASMQTDVTRVLKLKKEELHNADLVIIDECHLMATGKSREIIDTYVARGAAVVGFTATPLDLGDTYTCLIQAGVTSELRECGALVPCQMFGPDEPDLKLKSVGQDPTEKEAIKAMMTEGIFGRVIEHFNILNPTRRPSILFAPGVKESVWFAQQFVEAGVSAAHIDGEEIWCDGRFYASDTTSRNDLLSRSESGNIQVLCNRFVLREGIDAPWLAHGILATVFGSLQSYLQAGGRLLRSHHSLDHVTLQDHGGCLDTSTEVLTARGWVGHSDIRDSDTVAAFDRFSGSIRWCRILHRHERTLNPGEQMYEAKGRQVDIRVTGNHRFLMNKRVCDGTSKRWPASYDLVRADELSETNWRFQIPIAGVQASPGLRLTDDELRFIGWFLTDGTLECKRGFKPTSVTITQADHQPQIADLRACLVGCGFNFTERKRRPTYFAGSKPQTVFAIPKGTSLSRPRKGWKDLELYLDKNLTRLFDLVTEHQFEVLLHAIHLGDGQKRRNEGSYRISTGNQTFANNLQSLAVRKGWKCNIATVTGDPRPSPIYILQMQKTQATTLHGATVSVTDNQLRLLPSQTEPGTIVWCVANELETLVTRRNGKVAIIGNSWHRLGSLNEDRVWELGDTNHVVAARRIERLRSKAEREPQRCPKCTRIVRARVCPCGFEMPRESARPVVQSDGKLKLIKGDIYKPRRAAQDCDFNRKHWERCYWRAYHSKNKMTFSQAEALFAMERNWGYPQWSWPKMPREYDRDFWRAVRDVPAERLF